MLSLGNLLSLRIRDARSTVRIWFVSRYRIRGDKMATVSIKADLKNGIYALLLGAILLLNPSIGYSQSVCSPIQAGGLGRSTAVLAQGTYVGRGSKIVRHLSANPQNDRTDVVSTGKCEIRVGYKTNKQGAINSIGISWTTQDGSLSETRAFEEGHTLGWANIYHGPKGGNPANRTVEGFSIERDLENGGECFVDRILNVYNADLGHSSTTFSYEINDVLEYICENAHLQAPSLE